MHRAKAGLDRLDATWECDVFPMGPPVQDEGEAYIPAVVMIADSVSGFVVHVELGHPGRRDELVRDALMQAFEQSGGIPAKVAVARDEVQAALAQVAQAVGFELVRAETLPMVQEARESFEAHIGGGDGVGAEAEAELTRPAKERKQPADPRAMGREWPRPQMQRSDALLPRLVARPRYS